MAMKLYFESGQYPGRVANISPGSMTIGRGSENDLVLEAEGISRRHCRLYEEDDAWYVEDLGSTNGVIVNGEKITAPSPLQAGDRIKLYNQSLIITDEAGLTRLQKAAGVSGQVPPGLTANMGDDASADREYAGSGMPWGHITLLVILLAIVGWTLYSTFVPSSEEVTGPDEQVADAGEKESAVTMPPGEDEETTDLEGLYLGAEPEEDDVEPAAGETPGEHAETVVEPEVIPQEKTPEEAQTYTIVISSIPQEATLTFDGQLRGPTPVVIADVDKGQHTVRLQQDGFETLERLVYVPDTVPEGPYELSLKPGSVRITSEPAGATVFHGSQVLGQTPLVTKSLPRGENEIRVKTYGYEGHSETLEVDGLQETEFHIELNSKLGTVEVLTLPAGCRVFVDNTLKGTTEQAPDVARNQSSPFPVNGLSAGLHTVRVEHPNGAKDSKKVEVKPRVTHSVPFRLWVLDTRLVLKDGTQIYGMFVARNEFGDVTISSYPDHEVDTYLKDQIKELETLSPEEAQEFFESR